MCMKCPICDVDLHITERHGIEVDYCPKCRGVWLDRGELDKIIERASRYEAGRYGDDEEIKTSYDEYSDRSEEGHRKRKRSFWGEIFDFD